MQFLELSVRNATRYLLFIIQYLDTNPLTHGMLFSTLVFASTL
jgi:hypothetical protein